MFVLVSSFLDMFIVYNIWVINLYIIFIKLIYKFMNCEICMKRILLVFEIEFYVLWFFFYSF